MAANPPGVLGPEMFLMRSQMANHYRLTEISMWLRGMQKMQKRKRTVFLSFLVSLFLFFGASAAYAGVRIQTLHYSLSSSGPWTTSLSVYQGQAFYIQVRVNQQGGGSNQWASTHTLYRLGGGGWIELAACDLEPDPNVINPANKYRNV